MRERKAGLFSRKHKISYRICLAVLPALALAMFPLAGCGSEESSDEDFYLYYLNQEETDLVAEDYTPESREAADMMRDIDRSLSAETDSLEYTSVLPEGVQLDHYGIKDSLVTLYFNAAYNDMSVDREILCRGALAEDILQIPDVGGFLIYVDNLPLTDANGNEVGMITRDSFVKDPEENVNETTETSLTLYFANEDGEGLVEENQTVHLLASTSVEKVVVQRLMEEPASENARSAIPGGTQLLGVSVVDGNCVVNFDSGFMQQDFSISEPVVIYSIVNSLTSLDTVDTVQIAVNGDTNLVYREDYSLNQTYIPDPSLIKEQGVTNEVNESSEADLSASEE